jgi:hypothetical protein
MTGFLPRRRTAGLLVVTLLFVAVVSGFAGLYAGTEVFSSVKTPLDALYQLLYISPHRLLAKTWLWSTCSTRPARQQRSLTGCTLSLTHFANLDFQTLMNDGQTQANEQVGTTVGNAAVEQRVS